jgi:hypothetical protein
MSKWIWAAPLLLLAACSKNNPPQAMNSAACPPGNVCNNAQANLAGSSNPEPMAPAPAPAGYAGQNGSVVVASQPFGPPPQRPEPAQPYGAPPETYGAPAQPYASQPQPYASEPQPYGAPPQAPPPQMSDGYGQPVATPSPAAGFAERTEPAGGPARAGAFIPRGTHVRVRIDQEVDTRHNRAGDRFSATLYEPVTVNGATVLPVGTRFHGHLVAAKSSGRLRGRAVLGLTLDSFWYGGRDYPVETSGAYRESKSHKKRNFAFIGGGGGLGAAIGAIAGGGEGAAIGAASGVGAGVAGAAITGKKQVAVAAEAPLTFTLRAPVRI